ncbi:MAG: universal stress protein [Kiloniellaceae bacterium]
MKTILLPVNDDLTAGSTLDAAAQLALAFESYVEGLHLTAGPPLLAPADPFTGAMISPPPDPRPLEERRHASRALFEQRLAARGLTPAGAEGEQGACFAWRDGGAAMEHDFLGVYARVFDITVLTRPESVSDAAHMDMLETALFESGRPALLVPPTHSGALGENILIAWNGTPEAARTVAFAKPLLQRARRVAVVTLAGSAPEQPDGAQLVHYLRRNGIASEAHEVDAGGDANARGTAFLAAAERLGSDLVIKGAYTQSRLRQMIFGGATRTIVTEAKVPVLLAH